MLGLLFGCHGRVHGCNDVFGTSAGHARPAVSVTHGFGQISAALRQLMQASHVGKIVARAETQARSHIADDDDAVIVV